MEDGAASFHGSASSSVYFCPQPFLCSSSFSFAPFLFFAGMDRSALLFGLCRSTVDIIGVILDLDGDDSVVHLGPRDLDFFEIFSGAGQLSSEMQADS